MLEIEQALLDQKMAQLKEKAAERTLTNLESANGWILMEGNFQIQQEEDSYKFTYTHPVSDYISSNPRRVVTFFFNIAVNAIEEFVRGNYALSIGSLIPLKVYGQVWRPIDRSSNRWDLPIQPLAVYQ